MYHIFCNLFGSIWSMFPYNIVAKVDLSEIIKK